MKEESNGVTIIIQIYVKVYPKVNQSLGHIFCWMYRHAYNRSKSAMWSLFNQKAAKKSFFAICTYYKKSRQLREEFYSASIITEI